MIYLLVAYLLFSMLLIVRNYKSRNIIWFCFMLVGFSIAAVGLAYYSLYNTDRYGGGELFSILSEFMWRIEYYLDLDIPKGFRIMNIGTALYIFGAVCYPLSFINKRKVKIVGMSAALIVPLILMVVYDPAFIVWVYGSNKPVAYAMVNPQISDMYHVLNLSVNYAMKFSLIASIGLFIYVQKFMVQMARKKFIYIIIGIIPIHVFFLILFYWFPNHSMVYRRLALLHDISAPYNKFIYTLLTYLCILTVMMLIYAMWRYNLFDINVRKKKIVFQKQMDTAQIGMKVFSHTIKNQIVAIKLLAEMIQKTDNDKSGNAAAQEIVNICNDSIGRLGVTLKKTEIVRLHYKKVNVRENIDKIIAKYKMMNMNVAFRMKIKNELVLSIDESQFEKVVENLVVNAIEACSECPAPHIQIIIEEKDIYGVITVTDNGSGIDSNNIKKVFEPFFSTKPMSRNWGIGLSHCQKIIEAFGGVIEIESKETVGTQIHIYIPKDRGIL